MNLYMFLSKKINDALRQILGNENIFKIKLQQSEKRKFGDYQINGLIEISKKLNISYREIAENLVQILEMNNFSTKIDIIDPGFVNIFFSPSWIEKQISFIFDAPRLGISSVVPKTIVIDYSSPNIAKEMHVGHLRSTIIGDVAVRILSFLGNNVIRANHIGDWGTQFGMLIAYLKNIKFIENKENINLFDLDKFYKEAKKKYDIDSMFAQSAKNYVVKLQRGDQDCLAIWKKLVNITMNYNQKIYDRLNVTLTKNDIFGESFYQDMLPDIVHDLKNKKLAVKSQGAIVVFLDEFLNKDEKSLSIVIQKKDGAYLYSTTDIACIKYRYEKLKADRIIYYIDSRQHQYLKQIWTIARKAKYVPDSLLLEHHMFGMMLKKDGKPFQTRTGKIVKLTELLDEALEKTRQMISKKNKNLNSEDLENLAHIISIGAIKYADLSKNRVTDYIFNYDNMLNFDGNTAPYIQYAYARISSLFKKSGQKQKELKGVFCLEHQQEILLAVCLLQFEETITIVAKNGTPHILCSYLYKLSVLFSKFYENCPIIYANCIFRQSRLKLSFLTAKTLKYGLNLLGIQTTEKM